MKNRLYSAGLMIAIAATGLNSSLDSPRVLETCHAFTCDDVIEYDLLVTKHSNDYVLPAWLARSLPQVSNPNLRIRRIESPRIVYAGANKRDVRSDPDWFLY